MEEEAGNGATRELWIPGTAAGNLQCEFHPSIFDFFCLTEGGQTPSFLGSPLLFFKKIIAILQSGYNVQYQVLHCKQAAFRGLFVRALGSAFKTATATASYLVA